MVILSHQMLLALSGWISGYGGGFPFDKPGDLYGDHNYVGMRVVSMKNLIIFYLWKQGQIL